jgi:lipopolysaccharide/colanic/teichoic acid biosynthesis glycosyltransferase
MSVMNGVRRNRKRRAVPDRLGPREPEAGSVTPSPYFRWKGTIDVVLGAVLALLSLPVVVLLFVVVRITSPGPAVYRQMRVGKDGKVFTMYKVRTMRPNAEALTGAVWTKVNDCRVTHVGRLLRKLHLDEFPQLLNVLRGEMSLIGPRPERPEFVKVLSEAIPGYRDRLAVRPGITGLAQINLPPDSDLDSVRRKIILDVEYIKHAGPFLDCRMMLCTITRLLGLPGVHAMRLFGLERKVTIEGEPDALMTPDAETIPDVVSPTAVEERALMVRFHGGPNGNGNGDGNGNGNGEGGESSSSRKQAIGGKPR